MCFNFFFFFKARIRFLCEEAARDENVDCKKVMILIALMLHCTLLRLMEKSMVIYQLLQKLCIIDVA